MIKLVIFYSIQWPRLSLETEINMLSIPFCFGTQPFYVLLKKKAVRDHKQMYGLISQMVFSSPWKFASLSA